MAKRRKVAAPSAEHLNQIEEEFRRETLGKPNPAMAPISQVAGDAAQAAPVAPAEVRAQAAHDIADAKRYRHAAEQGRVIEGLPIDSIQPDVIVRDRTIIDPEEMAELKASILANGVRLPVEVFTRREGRRAYALISGFRRLRAVSELYSETGEARFKTIPALVRDPDSLGGSFAAMVEENEIRASLSHYERGRIAVVAAQRKAYTTTEEAVAALFKSASKAKRSKIRSFALIFEELGDLLDHAEGLKERDGLRLANALRAGGAAALRDVLEAANATTPDAEWAALAPVVASVEQNAKPAKGGRPKKPARPRVLSDVALPDGTKMRAETDGNGYTIKLQGRGVDDALVAHLVTHVETLIRAQDGTD